MFDNKLLVKDCCCDAWLPFEYNGGGLEDKEDDDEVIMSLFDESIGICE